MSEDETQPLDYEPKQSKPRRNLPDSIGCVGLYLVFAILWMFASPMLAMSFFHNAPSAIRSVLIGGTILGPTAIGVALLCISIIKIAPKRRR